MSDTPAATEASPDAATLALALYTAPFKFSRGYIFDARDQMVMDLHENTDPKGTPLSFTLRVRGWGLIKSMPNAGELQDAVGAQLVKALNNHWQANAAHTASGLQQLAEFGAYCLRQHRNDGEPGDIDGGEAQDEAVRIGLLETFTVPENGCGERCGCLAAGITQGDECCRYSPAAIAALNTFAAG